MAWWTVAGKTCVAAYSPIGSASLAASYTDLSGSGNNAAPGVAPTFDAAVGWTFNGTDQYLDCGPLLEGTTAQTVVLRGSIAGTGKRGVLWQGQSGTVDLVFIETDRQFIRVNGASTSLTYSMANGAQVLAFVNSAAAFTVYLDGASVASGTGRAGTFDNSPTRSFEFGRAEGSLAAMRYVPMDAAALAVYSDALSAAEVAALTTAMNALPTAAGSWMMAQHHHRLLLRGG